MKTVSRATIDDLYRVPENGKAELVGGEIVRLSPTGGLPGRASAAIYASLGRHEKTTGGRSTVEATWRRPSRPCPAGG